MQRTPATPEAIDALAPTGTLRAAINLSNFLLVTGEDGDGAPIGPSPGMAIALAEALGVPLEMITYPSPGSLADAATDGVWDIGNIGAEPARAVHINFTAAYSEIEATFMVPGDSTAYALADLDRPGVRIAVKDRAAYCLWLERHVQHAELVKVDSLDASFQAFAEQGLDANAGLRPRLTQDLESHPSSRLLEGSFMTVKQAMGTPVDRDPAGIEFLRQFVEHAKVSGLVARLIDEHEVGGRLSVAGPA
jgi:polar amino acid transport system substrate-binding protein